MTIGLLVKDIAAAIQGQVIGNESLRLENAAGLDDAGEHDISFFHNLKYGEALARTKAGAVLIPTSLPLEQTATSTTYIRVTDPKWAFSLVLGLFDKGRVHHPQGIHPHAIVDPTAQISGQVGIGAHAVIERDARIGAGTRIYPGAYIGERCRIGENCLIYPHVTLREDTCIGNNVIIHAGVVLGADGYGFATHDGRHHKIPQIGRVVIGNDVEIGANVTIDRATTGETSIGEGTKIDNLVHIAHNVQIGKHCLIVAQVGISGSTKVGNYVTLAGQVGLIGHLTIGDGAIIAAQSGIMNDVQRGEVLFGSPARPHREAMKLQALYGKLPEIYDICRTLKRKFLLKQE